jgi:hypothetical protein
VVIDKVAVTRRRVAVVFAAGIVAGIAAVAVVACDSDGVSSASAGNTRPPVPPSAAGSTSASAPTASAQQEALAAYQGMWQDFVVAGRTSDWQSPSLGDHATGVALQKLSRGLYADHYKGVVTNGEPVLGPSVISTEPADAPTKVGITDCGDSTNWLKYRKKSGELVDDQPGGRQLINAVVEQQSDGSWKVSDFGVHEVGSC